MEKKLGQEPTFATSALGDNEELYQKGMSQRLYIANGYADCAHKLADETGIGHALKLLGIDSNVTWDHTVHMPALIVKLQYMLADELLKQEHNG